MKEDECRALEHAHALINTERALLIGLLSVLLRKGLLDKEDLAYMKSYACSAAQELIRADYPLLREYLAHIVANASHFIDSFDRDVQ